MIRIVIADDLSMLRQGIQVILEQDSEIEVVGLAADGREAYELCAEHKPDVVLMDIGLPDISGIEATKQILEHNNNLRVIILTSHITEEEVNSALQAGASAYVVKDIATEFLMSVIKMIKMVS